MGLPILAMIAKRRRLGTTSRKSSSRLPARSADWFDSPVTLPPGRARLATRPVPTGSPAVAKTIGMTDVACFAATTAAVPAVTMTLTLSRTNSAAISAKRSLRPSAQRYSIAKVRPSIQPSSRSRCTNAAVHLLWTDGVSGPRNPIVGSFAGCCARAATGHAAAAPPRSVMKSRRFTRSPRRQPGCSIHQIVQLDHGACTLHASRVIDDLLVGRAVGVALNVCLCLPFGIGDELAALASAQQLLRDAALLRDHEGGAFSLPDALGGLGLRRINLDVNEADDRHGVLLASSGRSRCGAPRAATRPRRRAWLRIFVPEVACHVTLRLGV